MDPLFAGLPVIVLVTSGGFLTNAAYCLWQNAKNHTFGDYGKGSVWGNNLVFCALAGVLWYSQFFGLEMGKSFLDGHATLLAFSWSILMALNVTFSNVWGILLKEWKGMRASHGGRVADRAGDSGGQHRAGRRGTTINNRLNYKE